MIIKTAHDEMYKLPILGELAEEIGIRTTIRTVDRLFSVSVLQFASWSGEPRLFLAVIRLLEH